jgi:hypothetical protein
MTAPNYSQARVCSLSIKLHYCYGLKKVITAKVSNRFELISGIVIISYKCVSNVSHFRHFEVKSTLKVECH